MTTPDAPARKTKIICTIGPATSSEERLGELLDAGMNVARVNFSHGDAAGHGQVIDRLRRLADERGTPLAILQDLGGPKVRVGTFGTDGRGSATLEVGTRFTLTTRKVEGSANEVSVSYDGLPGEVEPGARILIADGAIQLEAREVTKTDIVCEVTVGGPLTARKGVNCPSGLFGLPILGEKDRADLRYGIEKAVDYVGLSFVRTGQDVRVAKQAIADLGVDTPVLAKIETRAALDNIDEILDEADGIMVARGDLGIETPLAQVPIVQKRLIADANRAAKPVATATQMLWSMVRAPRPTRAEVADVSNAVFDGSDALTLSEETAVGAYPIEVVRVMDSIVREAEGAVFTMPSDRRWRSPSDEERTSGRFRTDTMARAACQIANTLEVDCIVTVTVSGWAARFVAKHRPVQPVLAATPVPAIYRRLALVCGVTPLMLPDGSASREEMMQAAESLVAQRGWEGKRAVLVSRVSPDRHMLTSTVL